MAGWLGGGLRDEYVEPKEPALALDAWKGEFRLTVFRTLGTLRTMSASRRRPLPRFQPGMAAVVGLHWGAYQNMRLRSRVQSQANELDMEIEAVYQRREQDQ